MTNHALQCPISISIFIIILRGGGSTGRMPVDMTGIGLCGTVTVHSSCLSHIPVAYLIFQLPISYSSCLSHIPVAYLIFQLPISYSSCLSHIFFFFFFLDLLKEVESSLRTNRDCLASLKCRTPCQNRHDYRLNHPPRKTRPKTT